MTIDKQFYYLRSAIGDADNPIDRTCRAFLDVIESELTRLRSENERLLNDNEELRAIIKVLERDNKELSQYNKPADRG